MLIAEIASGFDAAVKAVGSVDGAPLVKYLVVDFVVGTEVKGREAGILNC